MSEFQNACYIYRSPSYKFRTSSPNTGMKAGNHSKSNMLKRKFKLLKRDIESRIDNEADKTQEARENIHMKFEKVSAKIDSIVNMQVTVTTLRDELQNATTILTRLFDRVEKIEEYLDGWSLDADLARKAENIPENAWPTEVDKFKETI